MFNSLHGLVFLEHDPALTLAAAVIGAAASLCAFRLRARMRYSRASTRAAWVFLGGAVLGVGAWSSDCLALASLRPGVAEGFEPMAALGALLLSVAASVAALAIAWGRGDRLRQVCGGMMLALALGVTRGLSLLSYRPQGRIAFEALGLWLAVGVCVALTVAGLLLAGQARKLRQQLTGAVLLLLGGVLLDAISGASATLIPDPALRLAPDVLEPRVLSFIAVMLAGVTTLGGLGAAYIDDSSSRTALQRTRRLADAAREGIAVVSETGVLLDVNAAFSEMVGAPVERIVRTPLAEFVDLPGELTADAPVETRLRGADGLSIPVQAHTRPLHDLSDSDEPTSVVVVRDLREQRASEDRIRFLAEHDTLTGLPNRAALRRRVAALLGESPGVMLTFVRIANHAETNSLFGHAAGDAVLEKLAERLKRFADNAESGYVCLAARLGGAEFAFAAAGEMSAADPFPQVFAKALGRPLVVDGQMIEPQVRVGVAAAPIDCNTVDELFRHAEVALDMAMREESVGGVTYFRQDLQDDLVARRALIQELKTGIAEGQLVVHYQPQVGSADGRLCGFEALVRWVHPVHGFMPPDRFIPAAEQSGLIGALGEQVLRRACADAVTWPHPVPVAVNLSPVQVGQLDLPRLVHEVLLETGLPPSRLELEITESALFGDFQRALDVLRRIKWLGVKIAMDDFGTGFSSLSTLQSFPFDKLKIDKSFVSELGERGRSAVIVKAVLGIGRGLEIPVVAEGVETAEQMALLRDEGCAVIQGYHIGKPAPIEAHQALFEALRAEPVAVKRTARRKAA